MNKSVIKITVIFIVSLLLLSTTFVFYNKTSGKLEFEKYYSDSMYHYPNEREKEMIIYLGEKGYVCGFEETDEVSLDDRYGELQDGTRIGCSIPGYETDKFDEIKATEINGNYYKIGHKIKIEGYGVVSAHMYLELINEDDKDKDLNSEEYNSTVEYYSHFTNEFLDQQFEYDLMLRGEDNKCWLAYEDKSLTKKILLDETNIEEIDEDLLINQYTNEQFTDKEIASCNQVIGNGYGASIYNDVVSTWGKDFENTLKEVDSILN